MIDHFIPQKPEGWSHSIEPNYYLNLVYSCSHCNLAKSNKWPTNDASRPNDGIIGFVNPTTDEYTSLFYRNDVGEIIAVTGSTVASYIVKELNLWLPKHSVIWRLEKLQILQKHLETALQFTQDPDISSEMNDVCRDINSLYRQLFSDNE